MNASRDHQVVMETVQQGGVMMLVGAGLIVTTANVPDLQEEQHKARIRPIATRTWI